MKNPENHPDNYKQNKLWKIKLSDSFYKWKCERIKLSNQMNEKKILSFIESLTEKNCVFNEERGTNGSFCALSFIWQRRERFSLIWQLIKMTKLPSKFNYLLFWFTVLYSFGQKFSHYREGPRGEEGLPQQFLVAAMIRPYTMG